MMMESATLIKFDTTGTDILGNPTKVRVEYADIKVRLTQWTAEDVTILGREVTANMRKFITRAPIGDINACSHINIHGVDYAMKKVMDLGRWKLVYISAYKGVQSDGVEY